MKQDSVGFAWKKIISRENVRLFEFCLFLYFPLFFLLYNSKTSLFLTFFWFQGFINDFVLTERNLIILKNEDLVPIIQLYKHSGNNAGISKKEKVFFYKPFSYINRSFHSVNKSNLDSKEKVFSLSLFLR